MGRLMSGMGRMSVMHEELEGLLTGQEMWVLEENRERIELGRRGTAEECVEL